MLLVLFGGIINSLYGYDLSLSEDGNKIAILDVLGNVEVRDVVREEIIIASTEHSYILKRLLLRFLEK